MRKLVLDDDILLNIEKPARYIGHEVNSVMKDKHSVAIRFAMCFPEVQTSLNRGFLIRSHVVSQSLLHSRKKRLYEIM